MDGGAWWAAVRGVAKSWHDWATSLLCIGEGNGNPLQCYCLENPRDGEPGGLPSMGSHRVGYNWSDLAAAAAESIRQEVCDTEGLLSEETSRPGYSEKSRKEKVAWDENSERPDHWARWDDTEMGNTEKFCTREWWLLICIFIRPFNDVISVILNSIYTCS